MATADLERRTGGDSIILAGRQKKYGEHIIGDDVFNGIAPDWSNLDSITAALRRGRFPFTRNTLDPTSETADSESIRGDNVAVPPIITSRGGGGDMEFEVLPGDAIHLLMGWFNAPVPANTAVKSFGSDNAIATSKISAPANGKVQFAGNGDFSDFLKSRTPLSPDWPGQLKISSYGHTGAGKIVINGQQRRSRSNRFNAQTFETINVADATDESVSKKFYNDIYEIDFIGFGGTLSRPTIEIVPDTQKASLTLPAINSLFPGWSLQMVKALLPFIAFDVIPNLFRLTVNRTSMKLLLTVLASYVQEGRTLQSPIHIAYKMPLDNTESPARKILAVYDYDDLDVYPAYGTALAIGKPGESLSSLRNKITPDHADYDPSVIVPITQVEITGNHNYTDAEGYTGDPVGGQPVTADNQTREVNVTATVVHRTDASDSSNATVFWQDRYFEDQRVPIIIQNYNWNGPGRQSMIESEFVDCKLIEVPGLPIEGSGQVNRRLAFQARPKGADKEIKMNFYSKNGFKE